MISRLKQKLKHRLRVRLFAKRVFVDSVRSVVRVAAYCYQKSKRLVDLAIDYGLDWHKVWDVNARPSPGLLPPVSLCDLPFQKAQREHFVSKTARDLTQIRSSVIIPVFNKCEFTFQCLRSLLAEVDLRTTEIIVVDDASTDETANLLAHFGEKIAVLTNKANKGFGETCNRGAQAATGRYLVFLNNDTWILPGWLSELEEAIDGDESIGAVGSMFLYPDGRVQEAGGIIWSTGEAFHYGWGKSLDDRRLNFAREVDYCSAASLLVRKDLFDRLGGFDPRYSPAYYEDTDLCMGIRSLGHKVIYQPASRLIHYEGVTGGTDVSTGLKQHQVTNQIKFREKWGDVLHSDHKPRNPANALAAADRRSIWLLVIDDRIPTPDRDAGSARMMLILKSMARWARPVFVSISKHVWPEYERELWKIGVETTSIAEYPRLMSERNFAAAIVSRPDVAEAILPGLRRRDPSLKIIFDLVDVSFARLEKEYELTGDASIASAAARYKRIEKRAAQRADLIWCASTTDQRTMSQLVQGTPSVVIPTVHPLVEPKTHFDEREGLLFLGNMNHRPNVDSLAYLVGEIMPLVWHELQDVVLYVVGGPQTPEVENHASDRVRILGFVPDIGPLFAQCRLMVAPLRFGAGINGKIGESLANGLPVVTTQVGAGGFGIRNEEEALVAGTPEELAAAVVRLYGDQKLWQHLANNGRQLIEANFSPEVVQEVIYDSIRDLVGMGLVE